MRDKKKKPKKMSIKLCGLLLGFCIAAGLSIGIVYAEDTDNGKLKNGSFEEEQSWSGNFLSPDQGNVPAWNTTASDGKIELFRKNTNVYIKGVTLKPTDGDIAAELNANEESTLYQNVATMPSSIYEWGLDHGARNGTDTMALVIGPQQTVNPAKPSKNGRDQLMQMVDWLIDQGKTSVKTTAGLGEHLVVYSKKFDNDGTFQNNSGNNAFSLTPSSVYTEEWHVWIIADSRATSGNNPWGSYGSNAEGTAGSTDESGGTDVDMDKYYLYTVPSGQTGTLFGFVSVGYVDSTTSADKAKTYGNFLDNVNFKIFHPVSGSTTLHGSGVVGGSDGTTTGEGSSTGYEVTVDKNLITYAVDGEPLRIQAVVKRDDAYAGCEFVGLYYTIQDASGNLVTTFLQKAGNEIDYRDDLTDEEKKDKWIKSIDSNGDIIYTYYLSKITTATDLHFIFIKSPTVTYDPNGGKEYIVERTYNTNEAKNVYSFKPVVNEESYTFISPYISHAAEGQNDGWKFMGWLLTGDTVDNATIPDGTSQINADKLGTLLLPAEHTIVCDYTVGDVTTKEQYFKIWNDNISLTENTDNSSYVKWETDKVADYANVHKGLTMVAQWRWRQAFIPQLNSAGGYEDSNVGGTVEIISVTDKSDTNYNGEYNAYGGKSYHAATDEIVTATATANEGYEFVGWYDEDGKLLTTKTTYSFTAIKEKVSTYYARFSETVTQTYIRQVKDGNTWSVIEGDQNSSVGNLDRYTYTDVVGKQISATAAAGEGYKFIGWYDLAGNSVAAEMLSADKATLRYTTTGEATYYARFEKTVTQKFVRQVKNGDGWTNTSDDSIATLNPYTHTDVVGATASSKATVGEGYKFVGWYDAEGEPVADGMLNADKTTIRYTTTGDATYYARFEKTVTQTFIRQVKNGDNWEETTDDSIGTLNSYTHTDVVGARASSTATAGEGYEFVGWCDGEGNPVGAEKLSDDGRTISYVTTGDATYYARFRMTTSEENVTQTFVRQVEVGESWEETTDDSIGILTLYNDTDVVGKEVSSTAAAGEGYEFVGWYDEEGNPVGEDKLSDEGRTLSYATTGNATYYARFSRIIVTQTYIRQVKNGDNWEETTDDNIGTLNSYTHTDVVGATASSTATAGTGYKFEGWYDEEGNPVGEDKLSDEGRTLSYATTGNATYYARFSRIIVTQTYIRQVKNGDNWEETSNDSIGTLSSYTHSGGVGETAGSKATAGEGYEFVGWYDSEGKKVEKDKLSSNGKALSYRTIGNATYYARFKKSASEENLTQTNNPKIEDEETEDDTISVENMIQTKVNQVKNGETLKDASKDISKDTSNDTPQTGDDSNPALWLTLMLLSMSALEGLFIRKKKDRK